MIRLPSSLLRRELGLARTVAPGLLTRMPVRAKRSWTHGTLGNNHAENAANAAAAKKAAASAPLTSSAPAEATAGASEAGANGAGAGATPAASGTAEKPKSKFWTMFREYGTVFVAYWGTCWIVCFVPIYGAIQYHLVPYDGMDILYMLGADAHFDLSKWSPELVNAAVAVECNEFLDLVRLPIIISTTPRIAQWLRSAPK